MKNMKVNEWYNRKAFSITELFGLVLLITFFYIGFKIGNKLTLQWHDASQSIIPFIAGISSGILSVLIFVLSCIGIGTFLTRRKKNK